MNQSPGGAAVFASGGGGAGGSFTVVASTTTGGGGGARVVTQAGVAEPDGIRFPAGFPSPIFVGDQQVWPRAAAR